MCPPKPEGECDCHYIDDVKHGLWMAGSESEASQDRQPTRRRQPTLSRSQPMRDWEHPGQPARRLQNAGLEHGVAGHIAAKRISQRAGQRGNRMQARAARRRAQKDIHAKRCPQHVEHHLPLQRAQRVFRPAQRSAQQHQRQHRWIQHLRLRIGLEGIAAIQAFLDHREAPGEELAIGHPPIGQELVRKVALLKGQPVGL
jgi:hypothetical protein